MQPNPAETFLQEAADLLQQIEVAALQIETQPNDEELINRLFRAFHTIKGCSGMFGFDAAAEFTHHVETALDAVRSGKLQMSTRLVDLVLKSKDQIEALLQGTGEPTEPIQTRGAGLIDSLAELMGAQPSSALKAPVAAHVASESTGGATYSIHFKPHPGIFATGLDPVCLLDELRALGDCVVTARSEGIPALDALDPTECHLAWDIQLTTDRAEDAIRDVFIFVQDDSVITIEKVRQEIAAVPQVEHGRTEAIREEDATQGSATRAAGPKVAEASSAVRVPSERLDRLVNLVGELVINQSRLSQAYLLSGSAEMSAPVEAMERLIAELRDSVLGIRMLPIGATFSRFQRLVRDLSSELGKEVELATEGAETELDKAVLDQLGDPLVHIIRNSIDHGLELPGDREAAGKPRKGMVQLSAKHEGGHVVISIADDGRGMDKAAIREKAEHKGLITPGAQLSDSDIFNLTLLPGFSTAKTISNVSGRGVGMDVVKRVIEGLRGSIVLSSTQGQGTVVRITLPLTLAIIDGLLVEVNGDRFIIPMPAVMENVEISRSERRANNGRNVVSVRGELIPYIRLRELFEIRENELEVEKIVIVAIDGHRIGLVVDRVLGSHQTVIQSLGFLYRSVELFSGTTIMGDGRVAMILNLGGIVRYADRDTDSSPGTASKVTHSSANTSHKH